MPMLRKRRAADAANKPVVRRQFRRYGSRCGDMARGAPGGDENRLSRPWSATAAPQKAPRKRLESATNARGKQKGRWWIHQRPSCRSSLSSADHSAGRLLRGPEPGAARSLVSSATSARGTLPVPDATRETVWVGAAGRTGAFPAENFALRTSGRAGVPACVGVCERLRWCSAVKPPRPASSASRRSPRRARSTRQPSRRAVLRCA